MSAYRPYPECKAQPQARKGYTLTTKHKWAAECSNAIDCDLWPHTGHLYDTPDAALQAWEEGKAFPDETPAEN